MTDSILSSVEDALALYRQGGMVIVVDDEDRENEGDLVLAADFVTAEAINFMVTHARGLVCLAMRGALLDRLQIPMMVPQAQNRSGFGTGFTLSVEAVHGVSTGISAEDRAQTIRTLIDPDTTPADIAMPGHMFPLRARDGGVLERRGQTEASVDLSMLAGLTPAGIICEVMREDGTMMRLEELSRFASEHQLPIISVEQLASFRRELEGLDDTDETGASVQPVDDAEPLVTEIGRSALPTAHGSFDIVVFRDRQGLEHSALLKGEPSATSPLTRVHSECLTGDSFGSLRCDCGAQLQAAMQTIEQQGNGVILYLRQEGRGIGLGNKIRAYELQDQGLDTVDANHQLGFPADARTYDVAAAMLNALGIGSIRLLSNNPEKHRALERLGIRVSERVSHVVGAHSHNEAYLKTKAEKMGHEFS
ncbi:3,4-dihydroxy-2-butanone-4-phosphate synthase [Granulosicoccus sp. 3-233]|uniref:3,4-dihydroxy-2-butanone-4-phosphate synthase n=1 Tax=Granulosicoccus sp. 3-233 TaxID=3417969 RepID=UPI003D32A767